MIVPFLLLGVSVILLGVTVILLGTAQIRHVRKYHQ